MVFTFTIVVWGIPSSHRETFCFPHTQFSHHFSSRISRGSPLVLCMEWAGRAGRAASRARFLLCMWNSRGFNPRFWLNVGLTRDLGCCRSSPDFWTSLRVRFLLPFRTACVFLYSMFCLACVFSFVHRLRVCSFPLFFLCKFSSHYIGELCVLCALGC